MNFLRCRLSDPISLFSPGCIVTHAGLDINDLEVLNAGLAYHGVMLSDHVVALRCLLLSQLSEERETTRRILAAIPEDRCAYRPHADARSALELAWHIVNSEIWFLEGVIHGRFDSEQERMPRLIRSIADVLDWEEKNVPGLIEELARIEHSRLSCPAECCGRSMRPVIEFLPVSMVHTSHHRGQLSVYLRAMGARVPSIYGGSADEPFPELVS
jgi:uncharacterized damage-inducible protein DinB